MTDNNHQPAAANSTMTIGQICEQLNVSPNTVRMQWKNWGFSQFDRKRQASEAEAAQMRAYYANGPKSVRRTAAPAPKPAPARPFVVTVENSIVKSKPKPATNHTNRLLMLVRSFTLSNIIIWTEIIIGLIGMTRLFNIPGFIAGVVMALFFENSRRTMTQAYRQITRSEYPDQEAYNEAYNATAAFNDQLRQHKQFAFAWCSIITTTFMWGNGQTFYAMVSQQAALVHTIAYDTYSIADVAARWLAALLSLLAFVSLRSISLKQS